jgi:hypothetical protein
MRLYGDKKQPVVTDFIDENVRALARLWNARRAFYIAQGMHKESL